MTKKDKKEMTFKEYWEEAKKRGESEIIEDPNFGMLAVLRREGFSDEQLNKMKMEKASRLYRSSIWSILDKYFMFIAFVYKNMPGATSKLDLFLKNIRELLKDKKKE